MTINKLKESGKKRRDGPFKYRAASMLHLGMADQRELCRELKINRNLLRRWLRWDYRQRVLKWTIQRPMKENGKEKELRAQVAELEKLLEKERLRAEAYEILLDIGKEKYGIDLRKKSGAKRRRPGQRRPLTGVGKLCGTFGKSRQAWYKSESAAESEDFSATLLLAEVRKIRSKLPGLGLEKLHHLLAERGVYARWGIKMGRDKLGGLLRRQGLLVGKRRNRTRTTNSLHAYRRHPNLAKDAVADAPNRIWVSDITYVPVGTSFSYLSMVTDACSRKIVGWHLSEDLSAKGCLRALEMAIASCGGGKPPQGLIHHSDRGVQYCCHAYTKLLKACKARISMTQNGDPYENALAERMNRTIKEEMLQGRNLPRHQQAELAVDAAIRAYNVERPHASLDFRTPDEVHRGRRGGLRMRWKKREKNFKKTTTTKPNAASGGENTGRGMPQTKNYSTNNCQPILG